MNTAYNQLKAHLECGVKLLIGHDSAAAALIQEVVEDDMQCLVFKCQAHLMRIHSKVQHAKFATVPYERCISQSKPGNYNHHIVQVLLYIHSMQILNFGNKQNQALQDVLQQSSKWLLGTILWSMKPRQWPKQQNIHSIYFHGHLTYRSFTISKQILTCGWLMQYRLMLHSFHHTL